MIGRADIEGSKSDVAKNAWPPQASYPCGNFSDTSCYKLNKPKGSIDRAFAFPMFTEHRDQASICSFALRVVSVRTELALGHLRYYFRDVPPQSNSPPGSVPDLDCALTILLILRYSNMRYNMSRNPTIHTYVQSYERTNGS
uniref:Senescence-associated protein n=1 Tax=Phlebotomus kandelakii TaxID=1109342 RepID=A0A6B2EI04_9DIPT